MKIIDSICAEFIQEASNTRKLMERIPEEHFDYKPHEKSMTMGYLASHIAEIPSWMTATLQQDEFVMDMTKYTPFNALSKQELLDAFEKNIKDAQESMKGYSDEKLMATWRMIMDGKLMFEMPRIAVIRGMLLNHIIHHRGQLEVYLRMKDVPLPSIYGPSADEDS